MNGSIHTWKHNYKFNKVLYNTYGNSIYNMLELFNAVSKLKLNGVKLANNER